MPPSEFLWVKMVKMLTLAVMQSEELLAGSDLAIAAMGAILGSLLTLLGDLGIRAIVDCRRFKMVVRQLREEVGFIYNESKRRVEARTTGQLELHAPLPESTWEELVRSGYSVWLNNDTKSTLQTLYSDVREANYLSSWAVVLLQTSLMSPDSSVTAGIIDEARRVSTEPYNTVIEKAKVALRRLNH